MRASAHPPAVYCMRSRRVGNMHGLTARRWLGDLQRCISSSCRLDSPDSSLLAEAAPCLTTATPTMEPGGGCVINPPRFPSAFATSHILTRNPTASQRVLDDSRRMVPSSAVPYANSSPNPSFHGCHATFSSSQSSYLSREPSKHDGRTCKDSTNFTVMFRSVSIG